MALCRSKKPHQKACALGVMALLFLSACSSAAIPASGQARIRWRDPGLESMMREYLGKPSGTISQSDLAGIQSICIEGSDIRHADESDEDFSRRLERQQKEFEEASTAELLKSNEKLERTLYYLEDFLEFPDLAQLTIKDGWITDLGPVPLMENLISLSLIGCHIQDISSLASASNLLDLNLDSNSSLESLAPLTGIPQLRSLSISASDDSYAFYLPIATLTNLEKLSLPKVPDAAFLNSLQNLSELSIGITQQSQEQEIDLSFLKKLKHLDSLTLKLNGDADLTPLSESGQLTSLALTLTDQKGLEPVQKVDLSALTALFQLRDLSLTATGNQVSKEFKSLAPLSSLSKLENLRITGTVHSGLQTLGALKNLKSLYLDPSTTEGITDFSFISAMTALNQLQLSRIDTADLDFLRPLTQMQQLTIPSSKLRDIGPLSGMSRLTTLDLSSNKIENIEPLSGLITLHSLNLSKNKISDLSPLESLTQLEALSLNKNELIDLNALSGLIHLKSLELASNDVADLSPLSGLRLDSLIIKDNKRIQDYSPVQHVPGLER